MSWLLVLLTVSVANEVLMFLCVVWVVGGDGGERCVNSRTHIVEHIAVARLARRIVEPRMAEHTLRLRGHVP